MTDTVALAFVGPKTPNVAMVALDPEGTITEWRLIEPRYIEEPRVLRDLLHYIQSLKPAAVVAVITPTQQGYLLPFLGISAPFCPLVIEGARKHRVFVDNIRRAQREGALQFPDDAGFRSVIAAYPADDLASESAALVYAVSAAAHLKLYRDELVFI